MLCFLDRLLMLGFFDLTWDFPTDGYYELGFLDRCWDSPTVLGFLRLDFGFSDRDVWFLRL